MDDDGIPLLMSCEHDLDERHIDMIVKVSGLSRSIKLDDLVYTDLEEYRDEWWWKWPAVVREALETEDNVVVEFMGFAQLVTRRRKFHRRHLKLLDSDQVTARIDRVLRYIRLNETPEASLVGKKLYKAPVMTARAKHQETQGDMAMRRIEWNLNLGAFMNQRVELETKEGHIRTGKLTKVECQDIKMGRSLVVSYPIGIELDGSNIEQVPFAQLVRLQLVKDTRNGDA